MDRRSFIAIAVAAGTATAVAHAADEKKPAGSVPSNKDVTAAAQACLTAAYACREVCVATLQKGDTMMAACIRTVEDMMPLCDAVAKLAASNSKHLKKAAAACIDACEECHTECKKHAGHMAECKACAEACAACIAACKTV